jgi:hypothetical protein
MTKKGLLLVLGLAGCPGPAQVVEPGQTVVVGDTTFRTGDRNTIDVTTRRSYEDVTGTGTVRLRDLDLDAAKRSIWLRVAGARAWLAIVRQLQPERAYAAARRGIEELGSTFDLPRKPLILDDSGMHAHLAEDLAANSDFQGAAAELVKVIETRVHTFISKANGAAE